MCFPLIIITNFSNKAMEKLTWKSCVLSDLVQEFIKREARVLQTFFMYLDKCPQLY